TTTRVTRSAARSRSSRRRSPRRAKSPGRGRRSAGRRRRTRSVRTWDGTACRPETTAQRPTRRSHPRPGERVGAKLRIVRRRIRSVQSTKKITRAMELIASSRIVRAQQRVESSRPYAEELTRVMEDVASRSASLDHPLLEERDPPARSGVLVVTSDRGLAGAYNANVLKVAEELPRSVRDRGLEPVLYVIGKKGVGYFRFRGVAMEETWQGFSEVPPYEKAE